jgi:gluconate 2-dehydrogenase gamma chain
MQTQATQNRREFLKTGLLSFAGVIMLPSCLKDYTPFRFFTVEEAAIMSAICEQIIPADENGPGATQAGVIYYIDRQLSEVFIKDQETYRKGLAALEASCRSLYDKSFTDLSGEEQLQTLQLMEANNLPGEYWTQNSSSGLFSTMVRHSMQGFYGPPRHGGNKNYISYKIIHLDYPYIVGQNRYRKQPLSW